MSWSTRFSRQPGSRRYSVLKFNRHRDISTIEGLSPEGKHPLQRAWIAEQVPQCGYCQSGQIMQAAALLAQKSKPTDAEIVEFMKGNLCRCATYLRIKRAIKRAAYGVA